MIAINDNYADGRDMSWLWDVEFDSLRDGGVDQLTGSRAYDMALRLQYDDVAVGAVNTEIAPALAAFIRDAKDKPKRIFCTYTAMLAIRRELSKITTVEVVSSARSKGPVRTRCRPRSPPHPARGPSGSCSCTRGT